METKKVFNVVFVSLLFLIISLIFLSDIFHNINNIGIVDWDFSFEIYAMAKRTILTYHQIPFWNPYIDGGGPFLANPNWGQFLSLTLIPVLVFGEVVGVKISILVHLLIGMAGMYFLSKYYKLKEPISFLLPFIFMLSGYYVTHLTGGHIWVLMTAFIPYVFLFYLKSFDDKKNIVFASIFLALMLLAGTHIFLFISLFLVVHSIFKFIKIKKISSFKILLSMFILAVLLSSIKLIPNIDFLGKYPRYVNEYSGYSLNTWYHGLLDRDQGYFSERNLGPFYDGGRGEKGKHPFITGVSHYWAEYGAYIGLIPLILFLMGVPLLWKKQWPLILTSFVFLWLSFGHRAPISLWEVFRSFPLLNMVIAPVRLIVIFIFCLAVINGLTLQRLYQIFNGRLKNNKKIIKFVAFLIVFFVAFDLILVNGQVLKDAFIIPPLNISSNEEFYQTSEHYPYSNLTMMYEYPNFLRNEGQVNTFWRLYYPTKTYAMSQESEGYKGEVFLQNTKGKASYAYWSPNKLIIDVNVSSEGYVVINQNYYEGWKTKNNRKVESFNGLISTKVYPGDKQIIFYYLPWSFVFGAVISLFSLIFILYLIIKWKRC